MKLEWQNQKNHMERNWDPDGKESSILIVRYGHALICKSYDAISKTFS